MSTFTLTFSDCSENHVGMQKIGAKLPKDKGITIAQLERLMTMIPNCELHELNYISDHEPASLLIIRGGLNLLGINQELLWDEHMKLKKDTTYLTRNGIHNKTARWNLCFSDFHQEPDIAKGKGTVYDFNELPNTKILKERLNLLLGSDVMYAIHTAEGNYYYDVNKCGITWHGDCERRKVIGVRVGHPMDLCFRWYINGNHDGLTTTYRLNSGDIYVMSEKTIGTDFHNTNIWTLRHAAGSKKYTM